MPGFPLVTVDAIEDQSRFGNLLETRFGHVIYILQLLRRLAQKNLTARSRRRIDWRDSQSGLRGKRCSDVSQKESFDLKKMFTMHLLWSNRRETQDLRSEDWAFGSSPTAQVLGYS